MWVRGPSVVDLWKKNKGKQSRGTVPLLKRNLDVNQKPTKTEIFIKNLQKNLDFTKNLDFNI